MKWDSTLYDGKHDFVSEYGKGLLSYIPDASDQKILDLGCGTGTLTSEISDKYPDVLGVDGSPDMIQQAKETYPTVSFEVVDALNMSFDKEWDIVFSNAVFHWIPDHDKLLKNIKQSLKASGKLICEFGGYGNIGTIEQAFKTLLAAKGYTYKSRFNFPTVDAFGTLLEKNGFIIDDLYIYDRPTVLKDGEKGLANWASQFFATDLVDFSQADKDSLLAELENAVRAELWDGTNWVADYKRLRAIAHI